MLIYNVPFIIPNATVLNANINSQACQLQDMYGYAIQVVIAGTPTGTIKLQLSCDPVPPKSLVFGSNGSVTYTPTNWTDVANSSQSVSAAGSVYWNEPGLAGYNYVRVVYTDGSSGASTATITAATFNGKGE